MRTVFSISNTCSGAVWGYPLRGCYPFPESGDCVYSCGEEGARSHSSLMRRRAVRGSSVITMTRPQMGFFLCWNVNISAPHLVT